MENQESGKPEKFHLEREFPGAIWYGKEEKEAINRILDSQSPFRYYGPKCNFEVKLFEEEFSRFIASKPGNSWPKSSEFFVTAVNSGTGALEVALDALGVGCGDEVITQGFMWIATISAIIRNRAIPVLVDSDDTLNMDPLDLKNKVTDRTKVIIPVPMLGKCAKIGKIVEVVREINKERKEKGFAMIRVLEDCAQCLGAHATGTPGTVDPLGKEEIHRIGTFGDVGIFSLQINKNITAGEGGMIVTRDADLHRRIEALHNVGYAKDTDSPLNWYGDTPLGWGQGRRMNEMQGAIARVQLKKLDTILKTMRENHNKIESYVKGLGLTPRARADNDNPGDSGYYCIFRIPYKGKSDEEQIAFGRKIAEILKEYDLRPWFLHDFEVHIYYNIQSLIEKWPMNNGCPWGCIRNEFHKTIGYQRGTLPYLDNLLITSIGINIPSKMTPEQLEKVCEVLKWLHQTYLSQS